MPRRVKKVKYGFKVCDDGRCYSKKPLTKQMAEKQLIAIRLSELRNRPMGQKNLGFKM